MLDFTRVELEYLLKNIRPNLSKGLKYPEDLIYINIANKLTRELGLMNKMFEVK